MLPFPGAKSARKEDISDLIFEAVARERGESSAAIAVTACRALQELRAVVDEPPTTNEIRTGLLAYLSALKFLSQHIPLTTTLDRDLLWVSAFDSSVSCAVPHLDIDYVSVLFNLGVCEAKLGVDEHTRRDISSGALVRASHHFTAAAAAFRSAAARPIPGGMRRATPDLLPEALSACEALMLGNALQCLYDNAVLQDSESPLYHKINARYAAGAAHYYRIVAAKCADPALVNTPIRDAIGRPAAALGAYFMGQAEISQAQICEKHCRMPEQLTRLLNAKKESAEAHSAIKEMQASTLQYLHPLKAAISAAAEAQATDLRERQAKADEENRFVYHGVEPEKNVARIAIREAVTQDMDTILARVEPDPRLAPLGRLPNTSESDLQGAAEQYAALVARTVAAETGALGTAASHLREALRPAEAVLAAAAAGKLQQQLKAAPVAPAPTAEDEKAVAVVRSAQRQGGLLALRKSYASATSLAQDMRASIRAIETVLAAEEAEDRQLRTRFATSRPLSKPAAHDLLAKLAQARTDVNKAADADNVVDAQLTHHAPALQALSDVVVPDAGAAAPAAGGGAGKASCSGGGGGSSDSGDLDRDVAALTSLVMSAKRALDEQGAAAAELERKQHLENPIAATARLGGGRAKDAALQALVAANYGVLRSRARELATRMDEFTAKVAGQRARLASDAAAASAADASHARVADAYRHQAAAQKFEELRAFLANGLEFYARQRDALAQLRGEADAFAASRAAEAAIVRTATPAAAPYAPPPRPAAPQQQQQPPPPPYGYAPQQQQQQSFAQHHPPQHHVHHPPPYALQQPYQRPAPPPHHYAAPPPQQHPSQQLHYASQPYAAQPPPPPHGAAPWASSQPPQDPR